MLELRDKTTTYINSISYQFGYKQFDIILSAGAKRQDNYLHQQYTSAVFPISLAINSLTLYCVLELKDKTTTYISSISYQFGYKQFDIILCAGA